MTKKSKTPFVLLGLLNHENLTGYDIRKIIQMRLGSFWNESFGQIYPTLSKLTDDGFVRRKSENTGRGQREKALYQITARGKKHLEAWLREPAETELVRSEVLLKIFFGGHAGVDTTLQHLEQFRTTQLERHKFMSLSVAQLKSALKGETDHHYFYLVALLGKMTTEAYLDWTKIAKTHLKKMKRNAP